MIRFAGIIARNGYASGAADVALMARALQRNPGDSVRIDSVPEAGLHLAVISPDEQLTVGEARLPLILSGDLAHNTQSKTSSDRTQSLLDRHKKIGTAALKELNGVFSGILLDSTAKTVTLFCDRYGLSRVYYCEHEDFFVFASEAKALLKLLSESRRFDARGLGEWLTCGSVLQNRTLFKNVLILPPGAAWIFEAGSRAKKTTYFDAREWTEQAKLSNSEFLTALSHVFPVAVERCLSSRERVGMSLTAGLDGRMTMAWANAAEGQLPCYTFNGPIRDSADVKIARRIAKICNQPHHTISVGTEFLHSFPSLAQEAIRLSDGTMDVTGAAEIFANRCARQIAPVRLTGNYGSELMRGNIAFGPQIPDRKLFIPELIAACEEAAETYRTEFGRGGLEFIAFKQMPWHHFARRTLEQAELHVRSPFLDNDLVALLFRASPESLRGADASFVLIARGNPKLAEIPTDRGLTASAPRWQNELYRLYHEFWAKAEYAYDYGMPRALVHFDRALSPLQLERLFLGRQKFCHFRTWYKNQLGPYIHDLLVSNRTLNGSVILGKGAERLVHEHTNGRSNHTTALHQLLTLELVHSQLLRAN